ncbi:MAG TPA: glycosyltransferase family 2 protein [Sphingobacteriaceae bacterium]
MQPVKNRIQPFRNIDTFGAKPILDKVKISLITATFNAEQFLQGCIDSVAAQNITNLEYIIVDGGSRDGTMAIVEKNSHIVSKHISEKDKGIYDAMNKGMAMATGDIIGILNADDFFPSGNVLHAVRQRFIETGADVVYGDLWYVDRIVADKVVRKWKSQPYRHGMFQQGWMPAHPTFYAKRELFEKFGGYDLGFGSAGDYELMVRFLHKHRAKAVYLGKLMVKMRTGGVSNQSLVNRFRASVMDYRAMKRNSVQFPILAILLKPLRKLGQFIK